MQAVKNVIQSTRSGFTLVELLVVIAIIGILAGMFLVSYFMFIERGRIAAGIQLHSSLYHAGEEHAVGIWNFEHGPNLEDTVYDTSGYGNHGQYAGGFDNSNYVELTPYHEIGQGDGKYGIELDGTGEHIWVGVPEAMEFSNQAEFTFVVWVKIIECKKAGSKFLEKKKIGSESIQLQCYPSDNIHGYAANNEARFSVRDSDGNRADARGEVAISDDRWYHLVGVRKPGSIALYFDGRLAEEILTSYTGHWMGGEVRIGSSIDHGSGINNRSANGILTEARIYAKALTAYEVQRLYAQGKSKLGIADE